MQYIIAGNNVIGDNKAFLHSMINLTCIHLQCIGNIAYAEDNKVQNLVVHLQCLNYYAAKLNINSENNK